MRITWKDGVATVGTAGAIVVERAYFHNYDWPLVSSLRWVIAGLAILWAINLIAGFAFDWGKSDGWDITAMLLTVGLLTATALGMYYNVSDYAVGLMLATAATWLLSVTRHTLEHTAPHEVAPHI